MRVRIPSYYYIYQERIIIRTNICRFALAWPTILHTLWKVLQGIMQIAVTLAIFLTTCLRIGTRPS